MPRTASSIAAAIQNPMMMTLRSVIQLSLTTLIVCTGCLRKFCWVNPTYLNLFRPAIYSLSRTQTWSTSVNGCVGWTIWQIYCHNVHDFTTVNVVMTVAGSYANSILVQKCGGKL